MEKEEKINNKAIVVRIRSLLDLWEITKDIKYYYEYQKCLENIKGKDTR